MACRRRRPTILCAILVWAAVSGCTARREAGHETDAVPEAQPAPRLLHPGFTLVDEDLDVLLHDMPPQIASAIREDPHGFLSRVAEVLDEPADLTVLVDKDNPLGEDYHPPDLVDLDTRSDELVLSRPGHRLRREATQALIDMSSSAASEGISLVVSSAYRSYEYQKTVYQRWVEELGAAMAGRVSAQPGMSQHQLGTAVDFGCICRAFADQPAGRWMLANAHRYGYSLSYPEGYEEVTGYLYEPWHFRYTGRAAAMLEQEFFGGLQHYLLTFLDAHREALETARR